MKHGICFIALLMLSAISGNLQAAGIEWLTSPAAAAEAAEKQGKPILVYVTSDNCYYCRQMDAQTWKDSDVAELVSSTHVPLKVSARTNPEFVRNLRVKGYPTTICFSSKRRYLNRVEGFVPAFALRDRLQAKHNAVAVRN